MSVFRLHYTDGTTLDIDADTPDAARKKAATVRDGIVKKIKVLKDGYVDIREIQALIDEQTGPDGEIYGHR